MRKQRLVTMGFLVVLVAAARGQLFEQLEQLSPTIPVGSGALKGPEFGEEEGERADGPKWVVTGDFDRDGKQDFATCHNNGELTVGYGEGDGSFAEPVNFAGGTTSLRSLSAADFNGDGCSDLAGADPYGGVVVVWLGSETREMVPAAQAETFKFARNIAAGDFDGDGIPDLAVGGPDDPASGLVSGVVYLKGLGDGSFERVGTTPAPGLVRTKGKIKPVFSLEPFRRVGETKDRLGVTFEGASSMWILSDDTTDPTGGGLGVDKTLSWWGNGDNSPYEVDSLAIGTLTQPAATGFLDLIAVMQDG